MRINNKNYEYDSILLIFRILIADLWYIFNLYMYTVLNNSVETFLKFTFSLLDVEKQFLKKLNNYLGILFYTFCLMYEYEVCVLKWTVLYQDLNPITNLWEIVDRKIRCRNSTRNEDLSNAVLSKWQKVPKETIGK